MKFIDNVEKNTVHNLEGSVTIKGDVSDGAKIEVKKGDLKIEGKVGNKVTIICTASDHSDTSPTSGSVKIVGTSGDNLTISCDGEFTAKGNIGDVLTVTTHNGNVILPKEIGAYARVTVENGDLTLYDHGQKGEFNAPGGDLNCNGSKKTRSNITADIPADRQDGNNFSRKVVIENGRMVSSSSTKPAANASSNNNNNDDDSDDGYETEDSDDSDNDNDIKNTSKNKKSSGVTISTSVTQGGTRTKMVYQTGGTSHVYVNSFVVAGTIINNTYAAHVNTSAGNQNATGSGNHRRSSNKNNNN